MFAGYYIFKLLLYALWFVIVVFCINIMINWLSIDEPLFDKDGKEIKIKEYKSKKKWKPFKRKTKRTILIAVWIPLIVMICCGIWILPKITF